MSEPCRKEGLSNNVNKSGQREGGLAVGGHPFRNGLSMREEGIYRSFYQSLSVL